MDIIETEEENIIEEVCFICQISKEEWEGRKLQFPNETTLIYNAIKLGCLTIDKEACKLNIPGQTDFIDNIQFRTRTMEETRTFQMNDIQTRLAIFQQYFSQLPSQATSRKSLLLLMLTQAEAIARQIKKELSHFEPSYKPVQTERLVKHDIKDTPQTSPIECCGKTFNTPQAYRGHLKSKKHQKEKNH